MESQRTQNSWNELGKEYKNEGFTLPDFETYIKPWWNKTDGIVWKLRNEPHINGQMILIKGVEAMQWGKNISSTNDVGIYDKLISRIYKELLQFDDKKKKKKTPKITCLKNRQRTWIDTSPKKISKWPISA